MRIRRELSLFFRICQAQNASDVGAIYGGGTARARLKMRNMSTDKDSRHIIRTESALPNRAKKAMRDAWIIQRGTRCFGRREGAAPPAGLVVSEKVAVVDDFPFPGCVGVLVH